VATREPYDSEIAALKVLPYSTYLRGVAYGEVRSEKYNELGGTPSASRPGQFGWLHATVSASTTVTKYR